MRVTDGADFLAWGDVPTGGGTGDYLVWFNGTSWVVVGADAFTVETWTPATFTIGSQSPTVDTTSVVRTRGMTTITIQFSGSQAYTVGDAISITGIPVSQYGTGVISASNTGSPRVMCGQLVVRNNGSALGTVIASDAGGYNYGVVNLTLTEQA